MMEKRKWALIAFSILSLVLLSNLALGQSLIDSSQFQQVMSSDMMAWAMWFLLMFSVVFFAAKIVFHKEKNVAAMFSLAFALLGTYGLFTTYPDLMRNMGKFTLWFLGAAGVLLLISLLKKSGGTVNVNLDGLGSVFNLWVLGIIYLIFWYLLKFTQILPSFIKDNLSSSQNILDVIAIDDGALMILALFFKNKDKFPSLRGGGISGDSIRAAEKKANETPNEINDLENKEEQAKKEMLKKEEIIKRYQKLIADAVGRIDGTNDLKIKERYRDTIVKLTARMNRELGERQEYERQMTQLREMKLRKKEEFTRLVATINEVKEKKKREILSKIAELKGEYEKAMREHGERQKFVSALYPQMEYMKKVLSDPNVAYEIKTGTEEELKKASADLNEALKEQKYKKELMAEIVNEVSKLNSEINSLK